MSLLPPIPRLLRDLRVGARKTQAEAGTHLGKTDKTISAYEAGQVSPQVDDFLSLLEFYGVADIGDVARPFRSEPKTLDEAMDPYHFGRPRESWVLLFHRRGVSSDALFGAAHGAEIWENPQDEADFVASARKAAEEMATQVMAEIREALPKAGEAEEPLSGSDSRSRSSAQKSGKRKRSPR